jgi:hypothetical protein
MFQKLKVVATIIWFLMPYFDYLYGRGANFPLVYRQHKQAFGHTSD